MAVYCTTFAWIVWAPLLLLPLEPCSNGRTGLGTLGVRVLGWLAWCFRGSDYRFSKDGKKEQGYTLLWSARADRDGHTDRWDMGA